MCVDTSCNDAGHIYSQVDGGRLRHVSQLFVDYKMGPVIGLEQPCLKINIT
jgi:hypothetical protein